MSRRERTRPDVPNVTWSLESPKTGKLKPCPEAPAITMHPEVVEFLADLLVDDLGVD